MSYHAARKTGTTGAPLVLTFHGTGGNEHQFHDFGASLMPEAHVTSPRGDVSEGGALRYFRRLAEGRYDMADLEQRTQAMAGFVASEIAETQAPETIGIGYSNGANILASVALLRPELVRKLVLLHPLIPWAPAPRPGLEGADILITAGERDPICPAPLTRQLAEYLTGQGANVTLHWHKGGHEIAPSEVEAMRGFLV